MHREEAGQRLQQILGAEQVPGGAAFDPSDAGQVEQAAGALLARFQQHNDGAAFELLVELTQPHLASAALAITREIGLAVSADELVAAHMARLFVDLRQPPVPATHFLDEAKAAMSEDAGARVTGMAARIVHAGALGADGADGVGGAESGAEDGAEDGATPQHRLGTRFVSIVSACFHRLDASDRRILIAREVDELSYAVIAERYGIYQDEVAQRIREIRGRLAAHIADAFSAVDPNRRNLP